VSGDVREVPFRFQLSDLTLLSVKRRLVVRAFGVDDAELADRPLLAPAEELPSDADGFLLRSLPLRGEERSVFRVSGQHPGVSRFLCYVLQCFPRYYIDMRQSFEDYKQKFSGKTRSTLARKVRKLAEHCGGHVHWQAFRHVDELDAFIRLAREVSAKTYQERLLDAGLPSSSEFAAEARRLAERDQVRAYILFDRDRPISYLYCPVHEGVIAYAYLGYDPGYRHLSVGTVLQWLALESLFNEARFRYFDFTEGDSDHKRLFATGHVDCANLAFLRPTLSNRLLVHGHEAFGSAVEALGRVLEEHALKARVRRWLRFGRAAS